MLQAVEPGPAQHGGEGEAQQHGIQEDKAADGGVRVLAEHHQRDEPDGRSLEVQLVGGVVGQRDADGAEEGVERPHERVVELVRVLSPDLNSKDPL